eukprot:g73539.t1
MQETKRFALFGGSFDPVHCGHVAAAIQLYEELQLDEVIFCPAWVNPFKTDRSPKATTAQRVEMLQLALQDVPKTYRFSLSTFETYRFSLSTFEVRQAKPSYTLYTVRHLLTQEKEQAQQTGRAVRSLCLVLGEDSVHGFPKWHKAN